MLNQTGYLLIAITNKKPIINDIYVHTCASVWNLTDNMDNVFTSKLLFSCNITLLLKETDIIQEHVNPDTKETHSSFLHSISIRSDYCATGLNERCRMAITLGNLVTMYSWHWVHFTPFLPKTIQIWALRKW